MPGIRSARSRYCSSTTLNAQAAGYNDAPNRPLNAGPSGFVIWSPSGINADVLAGNPTVSIRSARLDPTTLNYAQLQPVRGGLTVNVDVSVTNPLVARLLPGTLPFDPADSAELLTVLPLRAGTTDIQVQTPAGFNPSSNRTSITANFTGGFGIPAGQQNLALDEGAGAAASSESGSLVAGRAIDGVDTNTFSWCSTTADPQPTLMVSLTDTSTVYSVAIASARGGNQGITTGRIELYAPGASLGVDTPLFDSGTQAFTGGEIDFAISPAQPGIGIVNVVRETGPSLVCIGELGVIGSVDAVP